VTYKCLGLVSAGEANVSVSAGEGLGLGLYHLVPIPAVILCTCKSVPVQMLFTAKEVWRKGRRPFLQVTRLTKKAWSRWMIYTLVGINGLGSIW